MLHLYLFSVWWSVWPSQGSYSPTGLPSFLYPQIDRLFDWRRTPTSSVRDTVKKQKVNTKDEFEERVRGVVTEFAEQVWRTFWF